jgi:hypothetical protein
VSGIGVRLSGLNETVRALQRAGADVDDLKDTMAEIAALGARTAASLAPKRSGRLSGSIRGNRAKSKAVVIAGRARIPYAGAINYGWPRRSIRASHFLQRADPVIQARAVPMLEQGLDEAIRNAGLQ